MKRHRRGDGRPPSAAGTPFRPEPAERPAFWIVVALLWAVVFAIDPRGRESFRLPKELLGTALAAVSVVALAWSGRLRLDRGLSASPAARALAPLAGVAILSALLSPHPAHVAQTLPLLLVAFAALAGWSHAFSAATLDRLLALSPSPVIALNRIVAVQRAAGAAAAWTALRALSRDRALEAYPLTHAVRGTLLAALDRPDEARTAWATARELTASRPMQRHAEQRLAELDALLLARDVDSGDPHPS